MKKMFSENWLTLFKHEVHAMNVWCDAHQTKFSRLGDAEAYPTRSFHLQKCKITCYPISSGPYTHLLQKWKARRLFLEAAGWLTPGRSAPCYGGRRYNRLRLLYRCPASSKGLIKPEFQPSRVMEMCTSQKLTKWMIIRYGQFINIRPGSKLYIKNKKWGFCARQQ